MEGGSGSKPSRGWSSSCPGSDPRSSRGFVQKRILDKKRPGRAFLKALPGFAVWCTTALYVRRTGASIIEEDAFDTQADARIFRLFRIVVLTRHDEELAVRGDYPEELFIDDEMVEV